MYFINKLFSKNEIYELNEIDQTLQNIKSALIYKGLDFSVIFGENSEDAPKKAKRGQSPSKAEEVVKRKDLGFDITQHFTRFN